MKTAVYDNKGKQKDEITLPEEIFGLPWKANLVHEVVTLMRGNARAGTAHAKTRGEVSGGGKKPWQQKGTGRARHGSIRSPIWIGGGVAHGPRSDKNYERKINKKTKKKALYTLLSRKLKDGEVLFIEGVSFKEPKTQEAAGMLAALSRVKGFEKLAYKKGNRAIIFNPEKNDAFIKSFRNIGTVATEELRNMNPLDLINYEYVVILNPKESVGLLSGKK